MAIGHVLDHLSAYVDEALSPGEMRDIEAHLRQCIPCATELEQLRRVVAATRSIRSVLPPADLRVRVQTQLSIAPPPGWWDQIVEIAFHPWHIKLPLEAAGIIATAVFVVAVARVLAPMPLPRTATAPNRQSGGYIGGRLGQREDASQVGNDRDELNQSQRTRSAAVSGPSGGKDIRANNRLVASKEGMLTDIESRFEQPAAPPVASAVVGSAVGEAELAADAVGAVAHEKMQKQEVAAPLIVAIRLDVRDPAQTAAALADMVSALHGQISVRDPQTRWVELPADQYDAFIAPLARHGIVTPLPLDIEAFADYQAELATHKRLAPDGPTVIILLRIVPAASQ